MRLWKCGNAKISRSNIQLGIGCWVLAVSIFSHCGFARGETVKTASQPWVTNQIARAVSMLASTNQLAAAVAPKADANPTIQTSAGGVATNETAHVVYANVRLVIREMPAANGQKQFRLIRKND